MQIKYKLFLFAVLVVAASVTGCKKLVDVGQPVATITTEGVFVTNAQANSTLAAIYSRLMTNTGKQIFSNGSASIYAGLSADELVCFAGTAAAHDYQFSINALLPVNSIVANDLWKPAYKCIYDANAAIAGMAASTSGLLIDSVKKQLTGEAKFLRAFCYFYLTNFFGDVPLVLTTDFNKTAHMTRTAQEDVYKQIVQDLQDAQNLLTSNFSVSGGERIRANKWAATALLARVHLYRQEWAAAEQQATAVIENSQFNLVTNLKEVFNKNSNEAIWQLQQNSSAPGAPLNGTHDALGFIPLYPFGTLTPVQQALFMSNYNAFVSLLTPTYFLSPQQAAAFETNDKRKEQWLDTVPNPSGPGVRYPLKYTLRVGTPAAAPTQYYMVLRLAEQYLIRAEARAQQQKSGADTDINAIRSRAGLLNTTATTQAELLAAVAHERRVELFAEFGHRWLDLKRTGKAIEVLAAAGKTITANTLLYPIPSSEIINNPSLVQNNGY